MKKIFFLSLLITGSSLHASMASLWYPKIKNLFPEVRKDIKTIEIPASDAPFFKNAHRFIVALELACQKKNVDLKKIYECSKNDNWLKRKNELLETLTQEKSQSRRTHDEMNRLLYQAVLSPEEAEKFVTDQKQIDAFLNATLGAHYDLLGSVLFALSVSDRDWEAKNAFFTFHKHIVGFLREKKYAIEAENFLWEEFHQKYPEICLKIQKNERKIYSFLQKNIGTFLKSKSKQALDDLQALFQQKQNQDKELYETLHKITLNKQDSFSEELKENNDIFTKQLEKNHEILNKNLCIDELEKVFQKISKDTQKELEVLQEKYKNIRENFDSHAAEMKKKIENKEKEYNIKIKKISIKKEIKKYNIYEKLFCEKLKTARDLEKTAGQNDLKALQKNVDLFVKYGLMERAQPQTWAETAAYGAARLKNFFFSLTNGFRRS